MRNLIIAGMAVMLASAFLFSAEDDAEWRRRTGADPGKKTETPFAPTDVPDLILWLDANQGIMLDDQNRVAKWEDQSGSGNHLAAPNESLRPALKKAALNGMPVVSCAGFHGDHTQTFAQGVSGEIEISDQGISVFALVRQREEIFASCLFKYGPDNHKAGIGISMNRFGAWVDPDKDFSFNISSDRDLVGQGFQLLCLTADFARGVAEIYCHGQRLARLEKPDGLKVMPKGLFQLGGGRVAYTNCAGSCMSDIAEVLIFRRALLAEERRLIEMYLQKRWGLASLADITTLAMFLPFAYYPSTGEIELAFDKDAPLLKEYFASCHRTPDNQAVNLSPGLSWATWKERSDPQKEKPERTGTVTTLDLPGPTFDPPANTPYAIAGWLDIPKDGVYTFMLRPQSASALCIADKLVADQSQSKNTWGTWNWRGDAIALKAGKHRFFLKGEAQPRRIEHEKIPLVIWCGPDFLRQGALP